MRKFLVIALLLLLTLALGSYSLRQQESSPGVTNGVGDKIQQRIETAPTVEYRTEVFVENLSVPWTLAFTSPTRMLVTERDGDVRIIENGTILAQPLHSFEVSSSGEEGLMGLTLDPDYESNKYMYISYAYDQGQELAVRVVRFTDENTRLTNELIIIDNIPAARFHAGSRLRFGPDSKLYISTGDATEPNLAQNDTSLAGKILRLNADGTIPDDNPFPQSPIFSLGHRNPQGFDWHPITNVLYSTEHGPSGNDGPGGGDEVNLIRPGFNYGWPVVSHTQNREGMVSPLLVFTPAIAPASGVFYRSTELPDYTNSFLFGLLRGEGIMRVVFSEENPEQVLSYQKLENINFGRIRDIAEGPDGAIYFTTSNTDGRGRAQSGDDKIYRIVRE